MEKISQAFEKMVDEDIERCLEFLKSNFDETHGKEFHLELTAKYNDHIKNFGNGLYGYFPKDNFFSLEYLGIESLKHNIKSIKFKLISFQKNEYRNSVIVNSKAGISIVNQNDNLLIANQMITITFDDAKKRISEMSGLSDKDTEETLAKIDEIRDIVELKEPPKTKWHKMKPILTWIADKSIDVGITLLPLILKIDG